MKKSPEKYLSIAFARLETDHRITSWHVSLYMALFMLWTKSDYRDTFAVSRSALMKLSHIRSYMTYHKCIGQLRDFGYISYQPSYHPARGSAIVMLF